MQAKLLLQTSSRYRLMVIHDWVATSPATDICSANLEALKYISVVGSPASAILQYSIAICTSEATNKHSNRSVNLKGKDTCNEPYVSRSPQRSAESPNKGPHISPIRLHRYPLPPSDSTSLKAKIAVSSLSTGRASDVRAAQTVRAP